MKLIGIRPRDLEERGRLQYFYHSPLSKLPIRDVTNAQGEGFKTEPHIENGAENYLKQCYQRQISGHAWSPERYLFLFTRCVYPGLTQTGSRVVVGYIDKKNVGTHTVGSKEFNFVQGNTRLFSFQHSVNLVDIGIDYFFRGTKKLDEKQTSQILSRFKGKHNILSQCIDEIVKLDTKNATCFHGKDYSCDYRSTCSRLEKKWSHRKAVSHQWGYW